MLILDLYFRFIYSLFKNENSINEINIQLCSYHVADVENRLFFFRDAGVTECELVNLMPGCKWLLSLHRAVFSIRMTVCSFVCKCCFKAFCIQCVCVCVNFFFL